MMIQKELLPIETVSIRTACVERLEGMILSGTLKINEKLPSERDLARQLGVSRPVLHQALVDLQAKGLVRIEARRGVFVNDYRRDGSLAMLQTLLDFHEGELQADFKESMLAMRLLLERETARLAAAERSIVHLKELKAIIQKETTTPADEAQMLTDLDFDLHLTIAIASGNHIYPLIINSFKSVYTGLTAQFFHRYAGSNVVNSVHDFHQKLVDAIEQQDAGRAEEIMLEMLQHGATYLNKE